MGQLSPTTPVDNVDSPAAAELAVLVVPVPRTGGRGVMVSPGRGQRFPAWQMRPERQQPPIEVGQAVKDARPLHGKPVWRVASGGTVTGGTTTIGAVVVPGPVVVRLVDVVVTTTGEVLVVVTTMRDDVVGGGPGLRVAITVAVSTLTHPTS